MRFKDKIAIVTGAASGIGKATAALLAAGGAAVLIADVDAIGGEFAAKEIAQKGGRSDYIHVDVSREPDVRSMVEKAVELFGGVDILVNNAAVQILAKLDATSEQDWDRVLGVNLKGVFLACKHVVPSMIARGGGNIVNVASVLGFVGDPELAAYCAAKGGVISLTKVAALTYGPQGIRVNCVCPGDVETPLVKAYFAGNADPAALRTSVYEKYALRRIASPSEVADSIAFLASSESSFLTGSSLVIDGGLTVKCY
jgi:NAD(P)-dependent dehydrogenase (short-subunit alcohol dehydrogenase family)